MIGGDKSLQVYKTIGIPKVAILPLYVIISFRNANLTTLL